MEDGKWQMADKQLFFASRPLPSAICHLPFCLCACLFLSALAGAADDLAVTVAALSGEEVSGPLLALTADSCRLPQGLIPFSEIAEIHFAGAETVVKTPTFYLRNGDRLKAEVVSGDENRFKLKSAPLGEFELENKFVQAIIFPIKDGPPAEVVDGFLKAASHNEDALLLPKGDTLAGFLEKFTNKDLTFNSGGQARAYAYDQLAACRVALLGKAEAKPAEGFSALLTLNDGSTLTGKLLELERKNRQISFEVLDGKQWQGDVDALVSIQFKGGRLTYLSDLEPAGVEEKPYVSGMPLVYHWHKDRSVTASKLLIGGKAYPRGLGMHSYCKLTYKLDGLYAHFYCDAGLDGSAPPGAECIWRVLVDGKEVHKGSAKAGEKAQPLKIDLAGARELALVCDYGPDGDDTGTNLDWASARLIKP
jgi:hypothetical protein